ncbi:NosD domain-containing protein [Deltaproteobacteria bacterium IMCC39524]|nr:NosD domain-containing protein [Deltaproteobacteria bacterium IMCC39524]
MSCSFLTLKCYLLLGGLCLLMVGCLSGKDQTIRGVLHGEHVWQGEVYVAEDVVLEEDVRLTILPGTRVRFLPAEADGGGWIEHPHFPGNELIIKGQVLAVGTAENPIFFEAVDSSAAAGFWGAINLVGSPEAIFEYCVFRQADSAVHSWDSQVYIEQSIFEDNLVGIRFNASEILIEHNLLRNNHTAVRFHLGSPVICENEFADNAVNLFVTSHPRDYHIENNTFGSPFEYNVVFGEEVPEDVSLLRNYWIRETPSTLVDSFYDGHRSPYLGKVVFEPQRTTPSSQAGLSWIP